MIGMLRSLLGSSPSANSADQSSTAVDSQKSAAPTTSAVATSTIPRPIEFSRSPPMNVPGSRSTSPDFGCLNIMDEYHFSSRRSSSSSTASSASAIDISSGNNSNSTLQPEDDYSFVLAGPYAIRQVNLRLEDDDLLQSPSTEQVIHANQQMARQLQLQHQRQVLQNQMANNPNYLPPLRRNDSRRNSRGRHGNTSRRTSAKDTLPPINE